METMIQFSFCITVLSANCYSSVSLGDNIYGKMRRKFSFSFEEPMY
ncbi:rCG26720 [Rattus norvegicus]|uniref:RCG26720 n=1 Tax=Rattus norvegicus TaxID=10116 RepID=A6HP97_RAT|nr:rCG26720 [Rattus norvegicus]